MSASELQAQMSRTVTSFINFSSGIAFCVAADTCKYFGCELGAQTQMDIKNARYIVNGAHESGKLQDMLDGFIRRFVLCPECENPETELVSGGV